MGAGRHFVELVQGNRITTRLASEAPGAGERPGVDRLGLSSEDNANDNEPYKAPKSGIGGRERDFSAKCGTDGTSIRGGCRATLRRRAVRRRAACP
jgi:hypothetical protein